MLESILALLAIAFLVYFYIHERKLIKQKRKIKDTIEKLPKLVLKEKDLQLIESNNIDKDLLYLISIFFYITDISSIEDQSYDNNEKINPSGIEISIKPIDMEKFIKLKDEVFKKYKEYKIFFTEQDFNTQDIIKISLIKAENEFDILKIKSTNGVNHGYEVEDVIDWFEKLYIKYPFTILGAQFDWVYICFNSQIPVDERKALVNKIYKFCPDIVWQGVGKKSELLKLFDGNPTVFFFWWD